MLVGRLGAPPPFGGPAGPWEETWAVSKCIQCVCVCVCIYALSLYGWTGECMGDWVIWVSGIEWEEAAEASQTHPHRRSPEGMKGVPRNEGRKEQLV